MRATAIKGLAVRPHESEETTGTVSDLVLDTEERRIVAILLTRQRDEPVRQSEEPLGQGEEPVYVLDVGDLESVAEGGVTVREDAAPLPLDDVSKYAGMPTFGKMLEEKAMTESGDVLGKLADVEIDMKRWRVTGYEIVRSSAEALERGEHEISPDEVVSAGAHMLLVADSAAEQ